MSSAFVSFVVIGFLPLFAFVYEAIFPNSLEEPFVLSSIMTSGAFFVVGALKSRFVAEKWWIAGLETLAIGGVTAVLAYAIGAGLESWVGS